MKKALATFLSLVMIITIFPLVSQVDAATPAFSNDQDFFNFASNLGYQKENDRIVVNGKYLLKTLNRELYNRYGKFVYGSPQDVIAAGIKNDLEKKTAHTGQDEYRILGWNRDGQLFYNDEFPVLRIQESRTTGNGIR